MRVRQRQAMRHQPGARDAQGLPRLVIGRRRDRLREQRQQRLRRGQRGVAPSHQHLREVGDLRRFRRVGAKVELLADRIQRLGDPRGERRGRGDRRHLRLQPRELPPLHLQPQPQRVPPADVGAAVGVVADPARQDHRPRIELGPAIRPRAARHRQQRGVELVDRVAAMGDRRGGLGELLRQRDRGGRCDPAVGSRPPTGGLRQCVPDRRRQREGRMRGEHRRKPRPFHQRAIFRPAHRAVVRIRSQQSLRQVVQDRGMRRDVGAADIVGDAACTIGEGRVAQVFDQRPDRDVVQRAGLDAPADRQRHQQDGIAERVFLGTGGDARRQLQEFLGERPCPIEGSVRHHGILRRIVHCSKTRIAVPRGVP